MFDDHATIHEHHLVGDLARETDLMGDDHHGHAFLGEVEHDVEHFADEFRIKRGCRFVNSMISGFMASARAMATRCC